jgi:hypothetical protein
MRLLDSATVNIGNIMGSHGSSLPQIIWLFLDKRIAEMYFQQLESRPYPSLDTKHTLSLFC